MKQQANRIPNPAPIAILVRISFPAGIGRNMNMTIIPTIAKDTKYMIGSL